MTFCEKRGRTKMMGTVTVIKSKGNDWECVVNNVVSQEMKRMNDAYKAEISEKDKKISEMNAEKNAKRFETMKHIGKYAEEMQSFRWYKHPMLVAYAWAVGIAEAMVHTVKLATAITKAIVKGTCYFVETAIDCFRLLPMATCRFVWRFHRYNKKTHYNKIGKCFKRAAWYWLDDMHMLVEVEE